MSHEEMRQVLVALGGLWLGYLLGFWLSAREGRRPESVYSQLHRTFLNRAWGNRIPTLCSSHLRLTNRPRKLAYVDHKNCELCGRIAAPSGGIYNLPFKE